MDLLSFDIEISDVFDLLIARTSSFVVETGFASAMTSEV